MADPFTGAELWAAACAIATAQSVENDGTPETYAAAALRAVLPDHDARVTELHLQRIAALEALLACYRTGRQPSEALHRRLDKTREAIANRRAGDH